MLGPKREKVTVEWRRLHCERDHGLYSTSNIVRVIKSIKIIWAWSVPCTRNREKHIEFWCGNPRKENAWKS
jgi:hypothetical protein